MVEQSYKSRDWTPQFVIPEQKIGKFAIEHRTVAPGDKIALINQRTALFRGCRPVDIRFDVPVPFQYLLEDGGIWTSDVPQEREQQERAVEGFRGSVLVGGLGLGLIAHIIAKIPEVNEVIIVEKNKKVIDLVWEHLQPELNDKGAIVHEDLFKYLKRMQREGVRFNHAFYDIWRSDGEGTLHDMILPLRKLSEGVVKDKNIKCWNEDVMWGQVHWGLNSKCHMAMEEMKSMPQKRFDHLMTRWDILTAPFWRWVRSEDISKSRALGRIKTYVNEYQRTRRWNETWLKYSK